MRPNLTIVEEDGRFFLRDEKGSNYGQAGTQEDAEREKEIWEEYFNEPLPAADLS